MGPFTKGRKTDIVWCEVDQLYYLVQRHPNQSDDEHFATLAQVAAGNPSTMAGCNATGYGDLEQLIDDYVDRQINDYKEFINNLNKK